MPPRRGAPAVVCVGELMWDLFPAPGMLLERACAFERRPGGAAANVALELVGRHGVAAAAAGVVSDDALGVGLRDALARSGVDASAVALVPGRTGLVFIERSALLAARGRDAGATRGRSDAQRFLSYRPALARAPARLRSPATWSGAALHVAALEPSRGAALALAGLVARVRATRGWLSIDVNARPRAWRGVQRVPAAVRALLRRAHLVKASADDLCWMGLVASPPSDRALGRLRERWLGAAATLVVTRGARAAFATGPWGRLRVAGDVVPPERAAHAVGAGDAFMAGLLAALLASGAAPPGPADGRAWRALLDAAHAAAARFIRRGGPTRSPHAQ
jgi:sugar/nucleoside kinase (ribokinase family)